MNKMMGFERQLCTCVRCQWQIKKLDNLWSIHLAGTT
jgi:hypothetical protein